MTDTTQSPSGSDDSNQLMYEGLGHVVRALHDALTWVGADGALADASSEIPSARERLQHVAVLTERAANTVLNKIDETLPALQALETSAKVLTPQWDADAVERMSKDELRALAAQTRAFIANSTQVSQNTQQALTAMMMAQDFQDLTGQLIKKVVTVLDSTETDLLKLLLSGAPPDKVAALPKEELAGPGAIGSVAMGQSDVDAMLAELGF